MSILNTGSVAGLWCRGAAASTAPPRARCTSSPRLWRSRARRSASVATRSARRGCPTPTSPTPWAWQVNAEGGIEQIAERVGSMHPLGRPITAEDCAEAAVYLVSDVREERHRRAPAGRRRVRRQMTGAENTQTLDREELRRLFDLRSSYNAHSGGGYTDDPYPRVAELCARRVRSTRASCTSSPDYPGDCVLPGPAVPRPSALLRVQLRGVRRRLPRRRGVRVVTRAEEPIDTSEPGVFNSILADGWYAVTVGTARSSSRRSCPPRRSGGSTNWIEQTVHAAHRRVRRRRARRAQRRLRRRHPGAHHHRQLRGAGRAGAGHPEFLISDRSASSAILEPIIAARREQAERRPHQRAGRGRVHRRGRRDAPL